MRSFFILFFLFIYAVNLKAETPDGCIQSEAATQVDLSKLATLKKIIESGDLTLKQKQNLTDKTHYDSTAQYLASLPLDQKQNINDLLEKIKGSKNQLVALPGTEGNPVLMVSGLDFHDFPHEWIKPLNGLIQKNQLSYFFNWSKFNSVATNTKDLTQAIATILAKHEGKNLTIIGYSAGGVLTMHAMDELYDDPASKRIEFHTVAAPLYGYMAPVYAIIASPFVGMTSLQIGIGRFDNLKHKTFHRCTNFITTNCTLDPHTCAKNGKNPQSGIAGSVLPCGAENSVMYDDEGHASVLERAFVDIFKN